MVLTNWQSVLSRQKLEILLKYCLVNIPKGIKGKRCEKKWQLPMHIVATKLENCQKNIAWLNFPKVIKGKRCERNDRFEN